MRCLHCVGPLPNRVSTFGAKRYNRCRLRIIPFPVAIYRPGAVVQQSVAPVLGSLLSVL